jgi:prevent-host-death family protein
MKVLTVTEAKTRLSQLLEEVLEGKEVIIGRAGKPVAKLVRLEVDSSPREPGALLGQIQIREDFDELPDELLEAFEGR